MNKILRIVLVLILAFQLVPLKEAEAAWLSGYTYRKQLTITGQSGAGTLYQVRLTIDSTSGSANFDLEGHCANFPNDITFTDDDGSTELYYWIEDATADPITVWVKVTDSLESNANIYCYYGKSSDNTNDSDGTNTFLFFDDATGTYSDKWTTYEGSASYAVVGGRQAIYLSATTTNIYSNYYHSGAFIIESDFYESSVVIQLMWFSDTTPATNERYNARVDVRSGTYYDNLLCDGVGIGTLYDVFSSANTWVNTKLVHDGLGNYNWYVGGQLGGTVSSDTTYPSGYLGLNHHNSGSGAVANLRVRKYASPEPSFSLASGESTSETTLRDATIRDATIR